MKQGFKIVEIPIIFIDRRVGKSKKSQKIVIEAFTYVLRTHFGFGAKIKESSIFSTTAETAEGI